MKTRVSTLLILLLVPAALLLSNGRFSEEAQLQEPTAIIDPAVLEALEHEAEVRVLISLKPPDVPLPERTTEVMRQNAAERQAQVLSILTAADFTLIHQFEISAALSGRITESGLDKLASHADVLAIGMVGNGSYGLSESVPLIYAHETRAIGINGTGVDVAVLDTGIDTDHPDLSDSIIGEECFPEMTPCGPPEHPAEDANGHGTHVSGIITSNGGVAPFGVAHKAGIFAYAVGPVAPDEDAVLAALEDIEARVFPVEFVNMSFALDLRLHTSPCSNVYPAIEEHIDRLLFFGDVLSFAISHNHGDKSRMTFPACYGPVVAVGAVYDAAYGPDPFCPGISPAPDKVPCWSNSSNVLDLLAPGCEILSTWHEGFGVAFLCGTSQAVPHAVGVAALLKQTRPDLSAGQIRERLKKTGKWVFDDLAGRWTPRVDARVAFLIDDNADFDGDGCTTDQEFGDNVSIGGQRNPLDRWDFFDTDDNQAVAVADIYNVLSRFGATGDPTGDPGIPKPPAPGYTVRADRGGTMGPNIWNQAPPNGSITTTDIFAVAAQFGHSCL